IEVEKILNDRPITKVSSDPTDMEALTPSHILLLRRNPGKSTCTLEATDQYKDRWEQAHLLAEEFWNSSSDRNG
ncbi:predicted protein, partial [Nematostella vectensis]